MSVSLPSTLVDPINTFFTANQVHRVGHSTIICGASTNAKNQPEYPITGSSYQRINGVVTVVCASFPDADVGRLIRFATNNWGKMDALAVVLSAAPYTGGKTLLTALEITGDGSHRPDITLGAMPNNTNPYVHDVQGSGNSHSWVTKLNGACGGVLDVVNMAVGSTNVTDWIDPDRQAYISNLTNLYGKFDTAIVDFGYGNSITDPNLSAAGIMAVIDQCMQWVSNLARTVIFVGAPGGRPGGDGTLVSNPQNTIDYVTLQLLNHYLRQFFAERYPQAVYCDMATEATQATMRPWTGTFGNVSTTHLTLPSSFSGIDDYYTGANITIVKGQGAGQTRAITQYVGSTQIATTASAFSPLPDTTTSVFSIDSNADLPTGRLTDGYIGSDGVHLTPDYCSLQAALIADHMIPLLGKWTPFNNQSPDFVYASTVQDLGHMNNAGGTFQWNGSVPTISVTLGSNTGTAVQGTVISGTGLTGNMSAVINFVPSYDDGGYEQELTFSDPVDGGANLIIDYHGTNAYPLLQMVNDSRFQNKDMDFWLDHGVYGFRQNSVFYMEIGFYGTTAVDTRQICSWFSNNGTAGMFGARRAWCQGFDGHFRAGNGRIRIPANTFTDAFIRFNIVGVSGIPMNVLRVRMSRLRAALRQLLL